MLIAFARYCGISDKELQALSGGMPAKQHINLLVADRSATVLGSGSMGRPLGRHRPRSSIVGTDADTCCGRCILSLAAVVALVMLQPQHVYKDF